MRYLAVVVAFFVAALSAGVGETHAAMAQAEDYRWFQINSSGELLSVMDRTYHINGTPNIVEAGDQFYFKYAYWIAQEDLDVPLTFRYEINPIADNGCGFTFSDTRIYTHSRTGRYWLLPVAAYDGTMPTDCEGTYGASLSITQPGSGKGKNRVPEYTETVNVQFAVVEPGTRLEWAPDREGTDEARPLLTPNLPSVGAVGMAMGFGAMVMPPTAGVAADPVNTATGSLTESALDLAYNGLGVPFGFVRSYTSSSTRVGDLGVGWSHNFEVSLEPDADGIIVYLNWLGDQRIRYEKGAVLSGYYTGPTGALADLTRDGSGGYIVSLRDGAKYLFDSSGALTAVEDRNGHGQQISRDSGGRISSIVGSGGPVDFTYDPVADRLDRVTLPDGRYTEYGYDPSGQLTSVRNTAGHVTAYTYTSGGLLSGERDPNGNWIHRTAYDTSDRVVSQLDANDHETLFDWTDTADGHISTVTDPRGGQWVQHYIDGVLVKSIDPVGGTQIFGWNSDGTLGKTIGVDGSLNRYVTSTPFGHSTGNPQAAFGPDGSQFGSSYNSDRLLIASTDALGNQFDYSYDSAGNLTSVALPDGTTNTVARDPATGLPTVMVTPIGPTTMNHDANGNVTSIVAPSGTTSTTEYDSAGRIVRRVAPRGNEPGANAADFETTATYTDANQVATVTDAAGRAVTYGYDAVGNVTSVTDWAGRSTAYTYDAANHVTSVQGPDPSVAPTTYTYDANGNVATITDPAGYTTAYTYDAANRVTSETGPLGTVSYTYHDGRLATTTDTAGNTTAYTYDVRGRIRTIDHPDGAQDVTYGYDFNDNLTAITDDHGTLRFTYDEMNRVTSAARVGSQGFVYDYNAAGQLISRIAPGQTAETLTYDADGRLATHSVDGETTTYDYDADGRLTEILHPASHGGVETRAFDNLGRATQLTTTIGATVVDQTTIAYDPVDNIANILDENGVAMSFEYDIFDQLTAACFGVASCPVAADFVKYAYDDIGNRTSLETPDGISTYNYNTKNQLETIVGPTSTTSFEYDLRGQITSSGSTSYTWNPVGQLVSVQEGSGSEPPTAPAAQVVVGDDSNTTASDAALFGRLQSQGWDVTYVDDSSTPDGTPDLYVIAGSVDAAVVGDSYDTIATPVVVAEGDLLDDMRLVGTRSSDAGVSRDANVEIGDDTHPLAGGLTGTVAVTDRLVDMSWGKPAGTAVGDVHVAGKGKVTSQKLSFGYPSGAALTTGTAPEARVGFFAGEGIPEHFTSDGWALFDAAVSFAAGEINNGGSGTTTYSYVYDGLGNRIQSTGPEGTIHFQWDPLADTLATETDQAGTLLRRHLPDRVQTPQDTVYLHIGLAGTVQATTAGDGTQLSNFDYSPFGELRSQIDHISNPLTTPLGFAGEYTDPTGLIHLRARQYDPISGRFLSLDPLGGGYIYANNNPLRYIDPTGLYGIGDLIDDIGDAIEDVAEEIAEHDKAIATVASFGMLACPVTFGATCIVGLAGASYLAAVETGEAYDTCTGGKGSCAGQVAEAGLAIAAAAAGYAAAGQAAGAGRNALTGSSALDDIYSGARGFWDDLFGVGCRAGNSFVPGTEVLMADGTTKPIEDVNTGDYVWATDPETGQAGPRRVVDTIVGDGVKHLVDIQVDGEVLTATSQHPFWIDDEGRWVDAEDLQIGNLLVLADGTNAAVEGVGTRDAVQRVHNLAVEGIHTYHVLADDSAILVHNCNLPTRDATGKIHWPGGSTGSVVPTSVPRNWSLEDLQFVAAELRGSIRVRTDTLARLGNSGNHGLQLQKEKNFLHSVQARIRELGG